MSQSKQFHVVSYHVKETKVMT